MFSIDFKVDSRRLERSLNNLAESLRNKAEARAVNKTAAMAKTAASRSIRAEGYNIKAAAISKSLVIRRANAQTLEAVIMVSGKPIPLINYDARQVKSGVSVSVKNGRKIIQGAFIATTRSGHRGVFIRVGPGHKKVIGRNGKTVWSGLPIKQKYGPSVPQAVTNAAVQKAMEKAIKTHYPRLLAHEIRFILSETNGG